jgi:hypothetical protein
MTPFEKAVALEWRAYIGSFIRTGDPNKQKLASSPTWHSYGFLGDFVHSPLRLVSQFAFVSNANDSATTGTQIEVAQRAQLEREDWWTSEAVLETYGNWVGRLWPLMQTYKNDALVSVVLRLL